MNSDDQIGFLVPAGANTVLAVTIESGIFLAFKYGPNGKPVENQVLTARGAEDLMIGGYR